jgi:arylsulfatase A-like enzyme
MSKEEVRKWKYQRYIKDYLACIRSVDNNIGRVLAYLDEKGLAENTIVIYTSDQGFYLGDHGFFDKRFIYEESLRMPFLVRYPKAVKEAKDNNDIITNIDFAPIILEAAGVEIPQEIQGRSFFNNLLDKKPADWPTSMYYHYYEFPFWHHVHPHYGIRNERYKLAHFYHNQDIWEFYDLEKDPEEMINAIDDEDYSSIIESMKIELKEMMEKSGNTLSLDELNEITTKDFGAIN